jgi:signal transduction histidine kinase
VINSDYEELESVLSNYISNAINHIDGKRLIKIYTEEINDTTVRVNVENSGNNIPETEINNIWESFYKVDKARTRSYGGQGLGLSIVKTILETLGYDFGVRNVDGGVLFYFDIEDIESN